MAGQEQFIKRPNNGHTQPLAWRPRSLGPLALALALMIGSALLLGWVSRSTGSAQSNRQALGVAKTTKVERLDVHVETPYQGKDLEFNVSVTQTENDCQAAFTNGDYCLRYALIIDEAPVLSGYGMVPASDVHITPGNIVIHVDTAKVPGFVANLGSAQIVSVNWKQLQAQSKIGSPMMASAQGELGSYQIPTGGPTGTVIAHILLAN
jgi:hypothetical protein